MDKLLTVMNFSHVYENEKFYLSEEYNWVDCTNIIGTNGYCDESALAVLKEKGLNVPNEYLDEEGLVEWLWTSVLNK